MFKHGTDRQGSILCRHCGPVHGNGQRQVATEPVNRQVPLLKQVLIVQGDTTLSHNSPVRFGGHWQRNRGPIDKHVEPLVQGDDRHGLSISRHKGPVKVELTQTQVKLRVAELIKH